MKKMMLIASVAFAAVLAGCGGDSSQSAKTAGRAGKPAAVQSAVREYKPKVSGKAEGTLIWTANDAPALAPLSKAYVKCFKTIFDGKLSGEKAESARKFFDFLEKSGLSGASVDWFSVSASSFDFNGVASGDDFPAAAAVALDHDLDMIFESFKECSAVDKVCFDGVQKVSIEGCGGYKFPKSEDLPVDIVLASLDGKVLVLGDSEDAVAGEIALLRDGKGESKSFSGVPGDNVFSLFIPNYGKLIANVASAAGGLEAVDMVIPDGQRMLKDFRTFALCITASEKVKLSVEVETGSEKDAATLHPVLTSFIMLGKAQMQKRKSPGEAKLAREISDGLKLEANGAKLLLTLEIPGEAIELISKEMLKETGAED